MSLVSHVPEGLGHQENTCHLYTGATVQEVSRIMAVGQMLKEKHIVFSLYRDGYVTDTE